MRVLVGDCLEGMRGLAPASVEAIVTDPPAGIGFMGKAWDHHKGGREQWIAWMAEVAAEALRVAKPGAHALVWGLPRTSHWTATAWEDAGWEVRDRVAHLFGSGFPKSRDISKAIDAEAGAERDAIGSCRGRVGRIGKNGIYGNAGTDTWRDTIGDRTRIITGPATDAARRWSGWGTALKPACEDWWLLRKPLACGTVAANVLEHGVGGLNIDGCRVPGGEPWKRDNTGGRAELCDGWGMAPNVKENLSGARWPANVVHDGSDEVEEAFAAFGERGAAAPVHRRNGDKFRHAFGRFKGNIDEEGSTFHGDTGTASRFFYCAKAGRSERWKHVVCRCLAQVIPPTHVVYRLKHCPLCGDEFQVTAHPTQKPESLMRFLCRLITPPGGTVLDPFCGSGSTGCAAVAEGFGFIGIEADPVYAAIAEARISAARVAPKEKRKAKAPRPRAARVVPARQPTFWDGAGP